MHITTLKNVDHNVDNVCVDDEPMFLEEFFKHECDHSFEKICVEDLSLEFSLKNRKLIWVFSHLMSYLIINLLRTWLRSIKHTERIRVKLTISKLTHVYSLLLGSKTKRNIFLILKFLRDHYLRQPLEHLMYPVHTFPMFKLALLFLWE